MDCNFPALYATLLHLCAVITVHCVLIEPWSNCKPSSFLVVIIRYVTTWNTYIFNRLRLLWKVRRMCFVNLSSFFLRDGIIVSRSLVVLSVIQSILFFSVFQLYFYYTKVCLIFLIDDVMGGCDVSLVSLHSTFMIWLSCASFVISRFQRWNTTTFVDLFNKVHSCYITRLLTV